MSRRNYRANLPASDVNRAEKLRSISCWLTASTNSSKGKLLIQQIKST